MAMTASETVAFFGSQADMFREGIEAARSSQDPMLAAMNSRQVILAYLMQGLITWRCSLDSPVLPFQNALHSIRNGLSILRELGATSLSDEIPWEQGLILAYLLKQPPIDLAHALESDRLLVAVIGGWLHDNWNDQLWRKGIAQLRKTKGATLAVQNYETYAKLMTESEIDKTVDFATSLFGKRKKDSFYSNGDQTAGGGPDNDFLLDHLLAAILRKRGFTCDCVHIWRWS